jgi:hypothetical protein
MAQEPGAGQALSLEGEVVEIFEKGGQRLAKIMLKPRTVLDVAAGGIFEVHLGDRVVITGLLTVDGVSSSIPGTTTEPREEEEHT